MKQIAFLLGLFFFFFCVHGGSRGLARVAAKYWQEKLFSTQNSTSSGKFAENCFQSSPVFHYPQLLPRRKENIHLFTP